MTIEELEIIVEAKIEPAVKEMKKLIPQIKSNVEKAVGTAQKSMENLNMKNIVGKVQNTIQEVKKRISNLKNSNKDNEITIKVNNKEATKEITQLEKEIDSLQKKISAREIKLNLINPQIDKIISNTRNEVVPNGVSKNDASMDKVVDNALTKNADFKMLSKQSEKLYMDIELYNKQLGIAKSKMSKLKQEVSNTSTSQNRLISFFNSFKGKLDQTVNTVGGLKNGFSRIPNIAQKTSNNIKKMSFEVKNGLKHILKYVGALLSLRGIYSVLSSSAQGWLSSQNSNAKQLSANIEYMKYAMGSAFAPVIEYVIGLIYKLMKAIQSVIYALFKVNIFANASAKSYSAMAKNASKASKETKSLAGVHSEINNVQSQDNSNSGDSITSPNMDLSNIDKQISPISQKLHNFFKPLVDSWNTYSTNLISQVETTTGQVGVLISSVWGSFEKIITNGTVYTILENILSIIGNIAEAFANAWNYNGNGDAIVQNLANTFNNLLTSINNVVQSEAFQVWLNWCSDKFREISEKLSSIDWQPLINALMQIGTSIGTIALDILSGIVDIFKWLVENPIVAEIIAGIAIAIGVLSTAYTIWSTVTGVLTAVQTALNIALLPLIGIIVAIIAIIALIVLAIMNWDTITKALADAWEWIKEKAVEIWNAIADFFKNLWQGICDIAMNIWNAIKDFFSGLWQGIKDVATTVWESIKAYFVNYFNTIKNIFTTVWNAISSFFKGIWDGIVNVVTTVIDKIKTIITTVMTAIKVAWSIAWNGIKNTVSNIWNGIWNCIKSIINKILGGIENFVNGIIKGINFVLGGISKVASAVGSLIGLGPVNLQLSTISLPRLAKGNVAYSETLAVFGEYAGANNNPEITTPQNVMRDTFAEVLSDYEANENGQPIRVQVFFGVKEIIDEVIDGINEKTRQTGKAQIKVSYT